MDASTVPFAATSTGGQIKALGNPGVWWGVFGNFLAVSAFGAACAGRWALSGGRAAFAPVGASALNARGWLVPFVTLWSGYLLNLVPYQLIKRSKFVYHYIPALMVGVLLYATALEALWAAAGRSALAKRAAALVTLLCFASVAAGFWYWGIPYTYGMKISAEQNAARKWVSKW
jgi:dolichyl-phosphate-mannose--protein O-mannosyl transferase